MGLINFYDSGSNPNYCVKYEAWKLNFVVCPVLIKFSLMSN